MRSFPAFVSIPVRVVVLGLFRLFFYLFGFALA
jgi:hypothetical protein